MRIKARSLLGFSTDELWDILTGEFTLLMDDGVELVTNYKETLYSSYAWDFHREFPNTPLLAAHHVSTILGGKRLCSDTHLELLGTVMWAVYDAYLGLETDEAVFRDKLAEKVYRLTNVMYNDLTYRLEEYVGSLDITDFIAVLNQPDVKKANETVVATQQSIDSTYGAIKNALYNSPDIRQNPLSQAVRSKLVNLNQLLQCVGPRGYLTDTDSNIFPKPVLRGYAQGMRSFHDSFIESRSAAKSLIFSKSPLQQAEYFSRRLQLMSQIVQNLRPGDCGSTQYLLWQVRGPKVINGALKHDGDLKQLAGKYYLSDDGTLKVISASNTELIGQTLKLRVAIHCSHTDPYGICSTCFGDLALSVPENTNIGQMCCSSLAQKSSQNVLSVKHLDGSSVVDGIVLTEHERKFLKIAEDDNSYMLADCLKDTSVMLVIRSEQAANITDIMEVTDVGDLNITRVSELAEIGLRFIVDERDFTETIEVNLNQRLASMTTALLAHIQKYGWGIDIAGNYTIDMKEWDWSKPILTLPLKHFNMSDHSRIGN